MKTLKELTGRESGIVIYHTKEEAKAIICNWSDILGYPRLSFFGQDIIGLCEDIPNIEGEHYEVLPTAFWQTENADIEIMYHHNEVWPISGTIYYPTDNIIVIAPDGWN